MWRYWLALGLVITTIIIYLAIPKTVMLNEEIVPSGHVIPVKLQTDASGQITLSAMELGTVGIKGCVITGSSEINQREERVYFNAAHFMCEGGDENSSVTINGYLVGEDLLPGVPVTCEVSQCLISNTYGAFIVTKAFTLRDFFLKIYMGEFDFSHTGNQPYPLEQNG